MLAKSDGRPEGEVYSTGEAGHWSPTNVKEKPAKIDAKVVRHGHRRADALGAAGDQVDATAKYFVRGIDPLCPAS